jgi:hypothetical protein
MKIRALLATAAAIAGKKAEATIGDPGKTARRITVVETRPKREKYKRRIWRIERGHKHAKNRWAEKYGRRSRAKAG